MRRKIASVLAGAITVTVATLIIGAVAGTTNHSTGTSPYVSVLSDLCVKPAEAVPCNHKVCYPSGGRYFCDTSPLTHCALLSGGQDCRTLNCY